MAQNGNINENKNENYKKNNKKENKSSRRSKPKNFKSAIVFLTRIPIKLKDTDFNYKELACRMHLFIPVALIIGLIVSFLGVLLYAFFPKLIIGYFLLGAIIWITGGHHADGLIDFGDAIMATGTPERKLEIMHASTIGAGGFLAGFLILNLTALFLAEFSSHSLSIGLMVIGITLAEIYAKLSMVVACGLEKKGNTPMAGDFIRNTNKKNIILAIFYSTLFAILMILFNNNVIFYFGKNVSPLSVNPQWVNNIIINLNLDRLTKITLPQILLILIIMPAISFISAYKMIKIAKNKLTP